MKFIIIIPIKLYWMLCKFYSKKRICYFKISCSKFIYNTTKEKGFTQGIRALMFRVKTCRPGAEVYFLDDGLYIKLINGTVIQGDEISDNFIQSFNNSN